MKIISFTVLVSALFMSNLGYSDDCSPLREPIQTFHDVAALRLTGTSHGKNCSLEIEETRSEGSYSYTLTIEFSGKAPQVQIAANTCEIKNDPSLPIELSTYEELAGPWGGVEAGYYAQFKITRTAEGKIQSLKREEIFGLGEVCTFQN
jgi:hypothetical protein